MYERSAIVLERCFEKLFKFNQESNLKANYINFVQIVEQLKDYQRTSIDEESIIKKFDEIVAKIENIQNKQTKLHESNLELENERNTLFNDLGENPNFVDSKLHSIEKTLDENNEELKKLREEYIKALIIFIERQKERNKYARLRRKVESDHIKIIKNTINEFEKIDERDAKAIKRFITIDKQPYKEKLINTMIRNGKSEKIPFNNRVIEKAVEVRLAISEKEAELYFSVYEGMKKLLTSLESENVNITKAEKLARDVGVKLNLLNAEKEYIVAFLDNERLTVVNGVNTHNQLMEAACNDFELDIHQIDNLYELIIKETSGKATKKAYNELYNKTYLRDIEQGERKFEQEITNLKVNMGTVINSNYWRIEGIKNVYNVFQEEVTEKFNKDLSEYKIEEIEEILNIDDEFESEYVEDKNKAEDNEKVSEYEEDEDIDLDYDDDDDDYNYDDDDNYDYDDDDDYSYDDDDDEVEEDDYEYDEEDEEEDYNYDDDDEDDIENDDSDDEDDELEERIDKFMKKNKKKEKSKKGEKKDEGLLNKWFKKK